MMRWKLPFKMIPLALTLAGSADNALALDLALPPAMEDPFETTADLPKPGQPWQPQEGESLLTAESSAVALAEAPMTLAQLTEFALAHNPKSSQAWEQVKAAAAGLGMAESAYLPSVTLTTSLVRTQPLSTSGLTNFSQTRYGPGLTLNYVLYDFGKRGADVDAAGYRLMAAELSRNRLLQDVILAVEQGYYRLQGLEAAVTAARQTLESSQTSLRAAEARRAAGLATIGDVYRARTSDAQAKLAVQRAEGELEKARGRLANAVGVPVAQTIKLEPWPEQPETAEQLASIEGLLEKSKATRPDLQAAEAQVRAARANVGVLQGQGMPSLEVVANDNWTYFLENRPDSFSYNIGLQLKIPLFTGFQNTYAIRQGEAQLAQAEAGRDQMHRQIELEVWQAYFDLKTAGEAIDSASSLKINAQRSADAALERYKAGVGNLLDLLTAQADLANARMQDVQARTDWQVSLAGLSHALGDEDSRDLWASR